MSYLRQGAFVPGTTQNLTTSDTSQQTPNPVGETTTIIRVAVTQDTVVSIGSDPVADGDSMLISAGGVEYLAVVPGVTLVAVLQVSTSGIASITELAPLQF